LGKVAHRTLGTVVHVEQDAVLPTAASADPPTSVGDAQTARNARAGPGTARDLGDEVRAFNELNAYETDFTTRDEIGATALESRSSARDSSNPSPHHF
jgi:hypothetical protein